MKSFSLLKLLRLGNLIFVLLIGAFIALLAMMQNLSGTVERLSKDMIRESMAMTEEELHQFFFNIIRDISIEKARGVRGFPDAIDDKKLNDFFLPYIEQHDHISSILFANSQGDEFLLLRKDTIWQNRFTYRGSSKKNPEIIQFRVKKDGKLQVLNKYTSDKPYDPRSRPWFRGLEGMKSGEIFMTRPYIFFTTKEPGITISTKWPDPKDKNLLHYLAFDILLTDISRFTTGLSKTPNQKIFVLTEDNRLIGLPKDPRLQTIEDMKPYLLQPLSFLNNPVIETARGVYNESASDSIISFDIDHEKYWAGGRMVRAADNKKFFIGVIIPESDFLGNIRSTKQLIMGGFGMVFLTMIIMVYGYIQKQRINKIIAMERDKNEQLLLNTLPIKVVNDLKTKGLSEPEKFNHVTVFFSDIVGFTRMSAQLDPKKLINELNDIYTRFDEIITETRCERIKTIGDAYMAVCGMPDPDDLHAENILRAAVMIIRYLNKRNEKSVLKWRVRIGIHSGTVVGGIVGIKKYIYDVFGDTINTASRMETNSEPMRINISESTYNLLKDSDIIREFNLKFTFRESIEIKGKGRLNMYFVDVG